MANGEREIEGWVLVYPGLGSEHRNYTFTTKEENFEAQVRNGALIDFWPATRFIPDEKPAPDVVGFVRAIKKIAGRDWQTEPKFKNHREFSDSILFDLGAAIADFEASSFTAHEALAAIRKGKG